MNLVLTRQKTIFQTRIVVAYMELRKRRHSCNLFTSLSLQDINVPVSGSWREEKYASVRLIPYVINVDDFYLFDTVWARISLPMGIYQDNYFPCSFSQLYNYFLSFLVFISSNFMFVSRAQKFSHFFHGIDNVVNVFPVILYIWFINFISSLPHLFTLDKYISYWQGFLTIRHILFKDSLLVFFFCNYFLFLVDNVICKRFKI